MLVFAGLFDRVLLPVCYAEYGGGGGWLSGKPPLGSGGTQSMACSASNRECDWSSSFTGYLRKQFNAVANTPIPPAAAIR